MSSVVRLRPETPYLHRNDREPDLRLRVLDDEGMPFDLSGATVELRWWRPDGTELMVPLTPLANTGEFERAWESDDLAAVGLHSARIIATWPGGRRRSFPPGGAVRWLVIE